MVKTDKMPPVPFKEWLYSKAFDISGRDECKKASEEFYLQLMNAEKPRVHIHLEYYADKCNKCGKSLEVGMESSYAGYTRCHDCRRGDEEFDDEMS